MFNKELRLADLVHPEEWQKFQDSFSEALEVTLRTVSPSNEPLSTPSRPNRLCTEILPSLPGTNCFCADCVCREIPKISSHQIGRETNVKCPFGLDVFVIPVIAAGNRIAAYMILGPVILKARRSLAEYESEAKSFNIKLDELLDALIEINVFSYNKISNIIGLLRNVAYYMAQTGYHKRRLGEIAPEVVELDPIFSRYYEEKILSALLNSCLLVLGADSGSVMTLDKNSRTLHIKVAAKMDDDIVNNTNLKIGEGIAGYAAATAKPIILPKDENKIGISCKLNRKYIKSSMVIPFNKGNEHDVYGVINLNVVRKDTDFSERDIALVKELVRMAGVALTPLQVSAPNTAQ